MFIKYATIVNFTAEYYLKIVKLQKESGISK